MVKYKKLTYKTLFLYSMVVIALLIVAVPVVAAKSSGTRLLDFSFKSETGQTPQTSQILTKGINIDHLNPGEENWYTYRSEELNETAPSWISLVLRYESEALLEANQVNFEIFSQSPGSGWFQEAATPHEKLGSGLRSPLRTTRETLVESFWSGQAAEQQYYVRVFNTSPFDLDYTLEVKAEQPVVSGAVPAHFTSAAIGDATSLNARQLAWSLTAQAVENMAAEEAALWMKQAQAVGWLITEGTAAGSIPRPDEANPQTLWALTAQAIEGQDAAAASQWLIQADALGWLSIPLAKAGPALIPQREDQDNPIQPEPQTPINPVQPEDAYTPVNIYPNNPIPLNSQTVNSGRLLPYGEHWYDVAISDLDEDLIENMKISMFFTPRKGYISDRINFEIFPASQYHIWSRGDADYMENLGLGMWVSRDEDPDTGERLWSGTLVDGDRYLIKIKNGTPDVVDYYLYPDDVENVELGNPMLHASDAESGYIPYMLSPPTRSKLTP